MTRVPTGFLPASLAAGVHAAPRPHSPFGLCVGLGGGLGGGLSGSGGLGSWLPSRLPSNPARSRASLSIIACTLGFSLTSKKACSIGDGVNPSALNPVSEGKNL